MLQQTNRNKHKHKTTKQMLNKRKRKTKNNKLENKVGFSCRRPLATNSFGFMNGLRISIPNKIKKLK